MGLLINFPASLELTELFKLPKEACHLFCIWPCAQVYVHILEPLGLQNEDKKCAAFSQIQECRADWITGSYIKF